MKRQLTILTAAALLAATPSLITSCTTITGETTTSSDYQPGVPGGKVKQTTEINATVTTIDAATRKVTLVTRAGEKLVVTAGPEVANFPQIRVGDQLKVSYTAEIVVRMAKKGEATADTGSSTVDLAKIGAKPGAAISNTVQTAATVTEINLKSRKVTLQFSDGSTKKIAVRDDIDLSKHRVGEKVLIRVSEALAVKMTKP